MDRLYLPSRILLPASCFGYLSRREGLTVQRGYAEISDRTTREPSDHQRHGVPCVLRYSSQVAAVIYSGRA